MALLEPRFHSFSSIHENTQSGWNYCMSKAYCKWPAIVGIVVTILVLILTVYCCLRCCLHRRRGGGGRNRNRADTTSMFNPMPYSGYQPANNPQNAPPPYGESARFAQFDAPSGKKVTADSLPAMPSWETAQSRRVEEPGEDLEMGKLAPAEKGHRPMNSIGANSSSVNLLPQNPNYAEADSHPVSGPYETQANQLSPHYTGPDFGHGAGHPYTGPDFDVGHGQQTAYSGYTPSESTQYEPSGVNQPQELGTTYSNTLPPPSPSAHQQAFQEQQAAPSVLQAGLRPGQNGNTWRDV